MVIVKTVDGDLLNAKENYIAQQCNCITVHAKGLAKSIADKYSHGDFYSHRKTNDSKVAITSDRDTPGTIKINKGRPNIIAIFGQWSHGSIKSKWVDKYPKPDGSSETKEDRLKWFKKGITEIEKQINEEVAIPYKIGCGLGGGSWTAYKKILEDSSAKFVIYKID